MTLDEVHEIAGASLRREYHVALGRAAADAAVAAAGGGGALRLPPCVHCGAWPERPLHRGFGADVDAAAEVSDADVRALLERRVTAALAPLGAAGGVRDGDVAAAAALPGVEWNAHYQLLGSACASAASRRPSTTTTASGCVAYA